MKLNGLKTHTEELADNPFGCLISAVIRGHFFRERVRKWLAAGFAAGPETAPEADPGTPLRGALTGMIPGTTLW